MYSGLCYSQLAGGFLSVVIRFKRGLDYGGVFGGFKGDDGVCPELHNASCYGCDADGGFVEDAFDLAGDYYWDVLEFCGLC